jgi:hypothetical protein
MKNTAAYGKNIPPAQGIEAEIPQKLRSNFEELERKARSWNFRCEAAKIPGMRPEHKKSQTWGRLFLAAVFGFFILASCSLPADRSKDNTAGDWDREFWAVTAKPNERPNFYTVGANLLAQTPHCEVYAAGDEKTQSRVSAAAAQRIAYEFEDAIYSFVTAYFEEMSDVDDNGKITILLLDIQDGYREGRGDSYTAGFFSGYHCLSGPGYPNSNRADMLFMDTWPLEPESEDFYLTLAHEMQHLTNFNHHYIKAVGGQGEQDIWINEGLSSAAEYLYLTRKNNDAPTHVVKKIEYYKEDPLGDIHRGVNFITWAPSYAQDVYASYSTVYLFFQWLRIQAGSDLVFSAIAQQGAKDEGAIGDGLQDGGFLSNFGGDLLMDWFAANAYCRSSSLYGYKGDPVIGVLQPPGWRRGVSPNPYPLHPGEGLYLPLAAPFTPASIPPYVVYMGLDSTRDPPAYYEDDPFSGCDTLIVLNTNTQASVNANPGVDELSPLPAAVPSPLSASAILPRAASAYRGPPRPVDRVFSADGR